MEPPQFEIQDVNMSLCNETFHIACLTPLTHTDVSGMTPREYSCVNAEYNLQRSIGYHLAQSYFPTILIVVISWVSFWLYAEPIPGNLPTVSYVKAIDVWMGACSMLLFAALLEFTFVNYLWRKRQAAPE